MNAALRREQLCIIGYLCTGSLVRLMRQVMKFIIMASTQRQKLIDFINRKVFDPVLRADASRYNDHDKEVLHDVQDRTRKEKERFEKQYTSAGQVKENYLSDVNSEAAKKVDRQLRQLHLPTLPQHRDGFEDLCNRLGV